MQIEKIVLFLLEQQGLLASRIAQLNEQQEYLQEQPDIFKISELRESYREVGRELLKLLFFVEINAIGLRKILKKFDKRFGYRFTDYYVKTRANHPYSQLQQVFKHVVMCLNESQILLLLFPYSCHNPLKIISQQYLNHYIIINEAYQLQFQITVERKRKILLLINSFCRVWELLLEQYLVILQISRIAKEATYQFMTSQPFLYRYFTC